MTNIISFKSTRENFNKELHGIKCNTLREMDSDDKRFKSIIEMEISKNYGVIEITCDNSSFKRRIKDITFFKKFVIISWDNPDVMKKINEIIDKEIKINNKFYFDMHDQGKKYAEDIFYSKVKMLEGIKHSLNPTSVNRSKE